LGRKRAKNPEEKRQLAKDQAYREKKGRGHTGGVEPH